ncbi:MAG: hypothetical protein ACKVHE_07990 [Planctomycetales bacterium]|jgi:hypothetical protein
MSDPAHPLTLWLARASVAFYAVAVTIAASRRESSPQTFRIWRVTWSAACLLLIVHVLSAFRFEHGWSHSAALKHTAEQTARVTGIDWSGGLYFNYAFLALWLLDVALLWGASGNRQSTLRRVTNLACLFMVFNASVVFGPRWWIGPVVIVGLIYWQLRRQIPARDNDNRTVKN